MNQDLKTRIPTAIAYVLVILAALFGGEITSIILLWIFYGLCLHEFVSIESKSENRTQSSLVPIYIINNALLSLTLLELPSDVWYALTAFGVLYFVINGARLLTTAKALYKGNPIIINSLLYLTIPFAISIWMVQNYPGYRTILICLFVLIWISDAGAYFAGKAFGKNKLYPRISPGKTWEGMLGGGTLTLFGGFLIYRVLNSYSLAFWLGIAVIVWITAVIGDLSESAWKRQHGIKDSGTILPGHGGFLDRLDSFIYSSPFIALLIIIYA